MEIEITKDNFEEIVLNGEKPVLVDFWAPWCGPCRMLGPVVEEFAQEQGEVSVAKLNVDDNAELAAKFRVMTIPTLILFKNGKEVNKTVGLISKEDIYNLVNS